MQFCICARILCRHASIDQIKEGRAGSSGAEWKVHYNGFKASSDAWVTSDMIKAAPASEARPTKKAKHA